MLYFVLIKAVATFNQFFQSLGEACCRSPVDNIVIKTDRQAQILPQSEVPIKDLGRLWRNSRIVGTL
jgi:hypothetical protein